jgi:hypothetical protein
MPGKWVVSVLIATALTSLLPIYNKRLSRDTKPSIVAWAINAASIQLLADLYEKREHVLKRSTFHGITSSFQEAAGKDDSRDARSCLELGSAL